MIEIGQLTYPVPGRMPRRVIDLRPKARPRSTGSGGSTTPSSWRKVSVDSATMKVVVGEGWLYAGTGDPIVVPQTEVTVSGGTVANPAYIYLEHTWGSSTAAIATSSSLTKPKPDQTFYRVALHSFYTSGGSLVNIRQHRCSDIDLLGEFA